MIQAKNINKSYGRQLLFDNVSFTVGRGERVGLVGRNGHGKTTLFRMITGEETPDSGVISIPDGYRLGYLSQHLRFTERTVLAEGLSSLPLSEEGRDESYRVKTILTGLGFSATAFESDPAELSGGYQVRLNLAKTLIRQPDLLLLDEPTNYLDILSLRWLRNFLRSWKNEFIIITHDREFMDSVTTHTMGIHRCTVRKIAGTTEKYYDQLVHDEEVYEKTRANDERRRKEAEEFINRFRAQATKAKAVQSRIKALEKHQKLDRLASAATLDFSFSPAPFTAKWMMVAENLTFSYQDGIPLITGLGLSVGRNDRIAVIGRNGRGKTTLLELLAGELNPVAGRISRHPDLKTAYFGQTNINRLDSRKTVEEEILDVHPDKSRGAARTICGIMMFEGDSALKKISVLSGGEKSRVLLGKLLVSPANLLLLDEPTNHLDMESVDSLVEAIDAFEGAVILVTHSERVLQATATRLVVFDGGQVNLFEGTYKDFLDRGGWQDELPAGVPEPVRESDRNKGAVRREIKRQRAAFFSERSKVLGDLQKKIDDIENAITALEVTLTACNEEIVTASTAGFGDRIGVLSKTIHETTAKIDCLFNDLERLTGEHGHMKREFDERLLELEQQEEG